MIIMTPLLAMATSFDVAARAWAIVLFEHAGFAGRTLSLRGTAPNLETIDVGDRASSIRVRGAIRDLCADADFRGTCRVFRPGERRATGLRFNDCFSSARLIGQ
jgi:hypothetical protein